MNVLEGNKCLLCGNETQYVGMGAICETGHCGVGWQHRAETAEAELEILKPKVYMANGGTFYEECVCQSEHIDYLTNELDRLRRGDFTSEEFQNLCHNLHERPGCSRAEFEEGCRAYRAKLFGGATKDATEST